MDEPARRDERLSRALTCLGAALLCGWLAQMQRESLDLDPLDRLEDPLRASARWIDRTLESEGAEALEDAASVAFEVSDYVDAVPELAAARPAARTREALLWLEAGYPTEAREAAPDPATAELLARLAAGAPSPPSEALDEALAVEPDGWLSRAAGARLRGEAPPPLGAGAPEGPGRADAVRAVAVVLALAGGAIALRRGRSRRPRAAPVAAATPADESAWPWIGVWVRGELGAQIVFWIAGAPFWSTADPRLARALGEAAPWLAPWPLLWLAVRQLGGVGRLSDRLGLRPTRERAWSLAGAAAVAWAATLVGADALAWVAWEGGASAPWSESLDEGVLFGSLALRALHAADALLWTPLVEEIAFRGVLYLGLRRALGAPAAVVASAAVFALLHFYSLPGFVATLWCGVVWAVAFERTRSLWPGIVAHGLYNALWLAELVADFG